MQWLLVIWCDEPKPFAKKKKSFRMRTGHFIYKTTYELILSGEWIQQKINRTHIICSRNIAKTERKHWYLYQIYIYINIELLMKRLVIMKAKMEFQWKYLLVSNFTIIAILSHIEFMDKTFDLFPFIVLSHSHTVSYILNSKFSNFFVF